MKIKTEKTQVVINSLRIWIPATISINKINDLLKENRITSYHMWTRDPKYVSISYRNNTELGRAELFAKELEQLGNEKR